MFGMKGAPLSNGKTQVRIRERDKRQVTNVLGGNVGVLEGEGGGP